MGAQAGEMHIIPAVKAGHCITATFQLPSLRVHYRLKPEDYLSHLVGHEGSGSLLSGLKARGWASSLTAGVGEGGFERSSATFLFDVSITLTDAGLAAGPGELPMHHQLSTCHSRRLYCCQPAKAINWVPSLSMCREMGL